MAWVLEDQHFLLFRKRCTHINKVGSVLAVHLTQQLYMVRFSEILLALERCYLLRCPLAARKHHVIGTRKLRGQQSIKSHPRLTI
jgi:hypothetical protein